MRKEIKGFWKLFLPFFPLFSFSLMQIPKKLEGLVLKFDCFQNFRYFLHLCGFKFQLLGLTSSLHVCIPGYVSRQMQSN